MFTLSPLPPVDDYRAKDPPKKRRLRWLALACAALALTPAGAFSQTGAAGAGVGAGTGATGSNTNAGLGVGTGVGMGGNTTLNSTSNNSATGNSATANTRVNGEVGVRGSASRSNSDVATDGRVDDPTNDNRIETVDRDSAIKDRARTKDVTTGHANGGYREAPLPTEENTDTRSDVGVQK